SLDFDTALQLLTLPRVLGKDPDDGEDITAQNGRYGPYLKKGTDSRSIQAESQLFTITLQEALAIYAKPKERGRAAAAPLRDLGSDPVSGKRAAKKTTTKKAVVKKTTTKRAATKKAATKRTAAKKAATSA